MSGTAIGKRELYLTTLLLGTEDLPKSLKQGLKNLLKRGYQI